jgi:hypothetical protein
MKRRHLAALTTIFALSACGGGGGGATAPAAPVTAPQGSATIPLTLSIPRGTLSSAGRTPQFLSPSIGSIAIFDGTTLLYVANLALDSTPPFTTVYAKSGSSSIAFGSCTFTSSTAICNLTITTTVGAHSFDLVTYPGSQGPPSATPPTLTGKISAEGEMVVSLSPGTNPAQTLTLLGVASNVLYAGSSGGAFNSVTTYGYRIQDSTNAQIVQPGNAFDNGPVTITASPAGVVTIAPNSIATPPATVGDQNFTVTCVNGSGGSVTISFNTRTSPNTTYASGLTYTTANYSGATIVSIPFTCDPNPATIPITVQSKRRS